MPEFNPSARRRRLAVGALALLLASTATQSQTPAPITRADLLRHDISVAGHEAIQVRVDFAPGATAPRHKHPGEELVYVLRGAIEYRLEGSPPVTLEAGGVLFIPADTVHAATNTGPGSASELATYIVDKGRPLITLAP